MSESIQAITMPKRGLAMSEGLVTAWHIAPGADVQRGQAAVDIETEIIVNVFESPATGILRRQLVAVGDTVPVGALLSIVASAVVSDDEIDAHMLYKHESVLARCCVRRSYKINITSAQLFHFLFNEIALPCLWSDRKDDFIFSQKLKWKVHCLIFQSNANT